MHAGAPPEEFVRPAVADDLAELVRLEADHRTAVAATARGGAEWLRENELLGVAGWARVITDMAEITSFEPGDVLVAPQTDPSWTPLFVVASAVIVGVGAPNSHAMIVSRELGIPCVAGLEGAIQKVPDGAMVTVDGSLGTVTIDALP